MHTLNGRICLWDNQGVILFIASSWFWDHLKPEYLCIPSLWEDYPNHLICLFSFFCPLVSFSIASNRNNVRLYQSQGKSIIFSFYYQVAFLTFHSSLCMICKISHSFQSMGFLQVPYNLYLQLGLLRQLQHQVFHLLFLLYHCFLLLVYC